MAECKYYTVGNSNRGSSFTFQYIDCDTGILTSRTVSPATEEFGDGRETVCARVAPAAESIDEGVCGTYECEDCNDYYNNTQTSIQVSYQSCDGIFYADTFVEQGDNIIAVAGTLVANGPLENFGVAGNTCDGTVSRPINTPTPTSTATPTPTVLAPTVTPTPTPTLTTTPLVYENRLISASAVGSSDSFIFYKNECEVESNILLSSEGESIISAQKFLNGFQLSIPNDAVSIYVKSNLEDCPVCSGPLLTGNLLLTPTPTFTPTPTVSLGLTPTPTVSPTVSSGLRRGYIVRDCSSGDQLIASEFNVCDGEQISGQAFPKSVGDIIQFRYGDNCFGPTETQCGTIEEIRLVAPSTFNIILTSEEVIANCNDPECFN